MTLAPSKTTSPRARVMGLLSKLSHPLYGYGPRISVRKVAANAPRTGGSRSAETSRAPKPKALRRGRGCVKAPRVICNPNWAPQGEVKGGLLKCGFYLGPPQSVAADFSARGCLHCIKLCTAHYFSIRNRRASKSFL